ncbi:MAG: L,D-transpeptidase family protein, partial [Bauldia sp.]
NRLTWSGIALHAGQLPGYPASHGCVRLPMDFSTKLFGITQIGTPVVIADAATFPTSVVNPGMVLSADASSEFTAAAAASKAKAPNPRIPGYVPATSIMVSSADKRIMILDDGETDADGNVTIIDPDRPLGNHVFVLGKVNEADQTLRWEQIGYYDNAERPLSQSSLTTIQRIRADKPAVQAMRARMRPGLVLVTVDLPLSADTRTGKDFVIIDNTDES